MKLARSTEFDLAILDVNVGGNMIWPVADLISARNRHFMFATGYATSGIPDEHRNHPVLRKPFHLEVLGKMIDETLKGPLLGNG
jgi:hypothetical protein